MAALQPSTSNQAYQTHELGIFFGDKHIPNKVIQHILTFLSPNDRANSAATSRSWQRNVVVFTKKYAHYVKYSNFVRFLINHIPQKESFIHKHLNDINLEEHTLYKDDLIDLKVMLDQHDRYLMQTLSRLSEEYLIKLESESEQESITFNFQSISQNIFNLIKSRNEIVNCRLSKSHKVNQKRGMEAISQGNLLIGLDWMGRVANHHHFSQKNYYLIDNTDFTISLLSVLQPYIDSGKLTRIMKTIKCIAFKKQRFLLTMCLFDTFVEHKELDRLQQMCTNKIYHEKDSELIKARIHWESSRNIATTMALSGDNAILGDKIKRMIAYGLLKDGLFLETLEWIDSNHFENLKDMLVYHYKKVNINKNLFQHGIKRYVLKDMSLYLAKKGDYENAIQFGLRIDEKPRRKGLLKKLCTILLQNEKYDFIVKHEDLFKSEDITSYFMNTKLNLGYTGRKLDDFVCQEAVDLANTLPPILHDMCISEIAKRYLREHNMEKTVEMALKILSESKRKRFLEVKIPKYIKGFANHRVLKVIEMVNAIPIVEIKDITLKIIADKYDYKYDQIKDCIDLISDKVFLAIYKLKLFKTFKLDQAINEFREVMALLFTLDEEQIKMIIESMDFSFSSFLIRVWQKKNLLKALEMFDLIPEKGVLVTHKFELLQIFSKTIDPFGR